ncbi:hypothetical protein V6N13_068397 [Hibiscus sabdariffa]
MPLLFLYKHQQDHINAGEVTQVQQQQTENLDNNLLPNDVCIDGSNLAQSPHAVTEIFQPGLHAKFSHSPLNDHTDEEGVLQVQQDVMPRVESDQPLLQSYEVSRSGSCHLESASSQQTTPIACVNDNAEGSFGDIMMSNEQSMEQPVGGLVREILWYLLVDEPRIIMEEGFPNASGRKHPFKGMRSSKFFLHPAGDTPTSC